MSKGHGKWERAILEALEEVTAFYLTDLLPISHTRANVVALNRAARNLTSMGKINVSSWKVRCTSPDEEPHGYLTVFRSGYPNPRRHQITRLKRCMSSTAEAVQHLATTARKRRKRGPEQVAPDQN
jgi:hypothetical protein